MLIPYKGMKGENIIKKSEVFLFFGFKCKQFEFSIPLKSPFNIGKSAPGLVLQLKGDERRLR